MPMAVPVASEEVTDHMEVENAGEGKQYQILDAAARMFASYGFNKTNMGDVVREAGVARATLYKYYSSKDALFHAVVSREGNQMLDAVSDAVSAATSTRERLRLAIITHTDLIRQKLNVLRVSLEAAADIMSRWRHETDELQEKALDFYAGIIEQGVECEEIESDDPRATALLLMYMMKGLFLGVLTGQVGAERDRLVDGMLDMVLDGLRPREEVT
jgi:AcrR family transcriptional regulator